MAAGVVVTCPECEKKFRPKTDVQGKKIKCPFCTHPFVVPLTKEAKGKPAAAKAGKADPDAKASPDAKAVADEQKPAGDDDENPDPYGVKTVELVPRCPNCTEEMGEHDTICLACGYNTLTREWGKTAKVVGLTFGRHLLYLLPAIAAAIFAFMTIVSLLFYGTVYPVLIADVGWMGWSDHESMRMWSTVINLTWVWAAGVYCFKKFIAKPKPEEIVLD